MNKTMNAMRLHRTCDITDQPLRMDEVNRCKDIITDDILTMNMAIYLRKRIYFLETAPVNLKLEFFGSKHTVIDVPYNFLTG